MAGPRLEKLDRCGDEQLAGLDHADVPSGIPLTAAINRLLHRLDQTLAQQKRFVADAAPF